MIAVSIDSLSDLHRKIKDQTLIVQPSEILVNRKIRIDKYAQTWVIDEKDSKGGDCSWVMIRLPEEADRCIHCKGSWDIYNILDYRYYHGSKSHKSCALIVNSHEERTTITDSLRKAGFDAYRIKESNNKYWPEAYSEDARFTPWYRITTFKGVLEIGKRKRVMSIRLVSHKESSYLKESYLDFTQMFALEDVTKGRDFIHAWTDDKLVEYLTTIRQNLEQL